MTKRFVPLLVVIVLMVLTSCNPTIYFTQDMRNNLHDNRLEIKDVQFYVSRKLVIKRNLTYEETKIARGEIKFENGQYVEEIVIPKNTPGVAINSKRNRIDVAFEQGFNRDLNFILNDENLYQITAMSWENDYGRIKYDTLIYFMEPGGDKALLKVRKDNIYNFQKKKRVVKGRTVGR